MPEIILNAHAAKSFEISASAVLCIMSSVPCSVRNVLYETSTIIKRIN